MNICIAGKNQISVDITSFLIKKGYSKNILVIPNNDDNNIDGWQPSFKKFAIKNNLKIIDLEIAYEINDLIFISAEFNKLINPKKFKTNNLFNIHFSYLPSYKGAYTSIWPILNNEKYSGVTIHKIDSGIDTGNIIIRKKFLIEKNMTSRGLYFKYMLVAKKLFIRTIDDILKNSFIEIEQSNLGSSFYSRNSIDFQNLNINFKNTSQTIHNYIRAFTFKEYQKLKILNKCVLKSEMLNTRSFNPPSEIKFKGDNYIIYNTLDYDIKIFFE